MDAELRRLATKALTGGVEDKARLLAARVRSEASSLTVACSGPVCSSPWQEGEKLRNVETDEIMGTVGRCKPCNGTGRVTVAWEDRLALMAYCGDGAARELFCGSAMPNHSAARRTILVFSPPKDLSPWLRGLSRWPPEVLLRSALAAGEAVLKTVYLDDPRIETCSDPDCGSVICLAERALAACRAYVEDPTEERREAWVRAMADMPLWVPEPHPTAFGPGGPGMCTRSGAILAAARETSEETIRAAASEALAGWALQ